MLQPGVATYMDIEGTTMNMLGNWFFGFEAVILNTLGTIANMSGDELFGYEAVITNTLGNIVNMLSNEFVGAVATYTNFEDAVINMLGNGLFGYETVIMNMPVILMNMSVILMNIIGDHRNDNGAENVNYVYTLLNGAEAGRAQSAVWLDRVISCCT